MDPGGRIMHGERYPDATHAGAIVDRLNEENIQLRAALSEKSRECEELKLELAQHRRMASRLATEERMAKGD
jgi:predicted RNase H-like nuclease (RuvC/YqgF family)